MRRIEPLLILLALYSLMGNSQSVFAAKTQRNSRGGVSDCGSSVSQQPQTENLHASHFPTKPPGTIGYQGFDESMGNQNVDRTDGVGGLATWDTGLNRGFDYSGNEGF